MAVFITICPIYKAGTYSKIRTLEILTLIYELSNIKAVPLDSYFNVYSSSKCIITI